MPGLGKSGTSRMRAFRSFIWMVGDIAKPLIVAGARLRLLADFKHHGRRANTSRFIKQSDYSVARFGHFRWRNSNGHRSAIRCCDGVSLNVIPEDSRRRCDAAAFNPERTLTVALRVH